MGYLWPGTVVQLRCIRYIRLAVCRLLARQIMMMVDCTTRCEIQSPTYWSANKVDVFAFEENRLSAIMAVLSLVIDNQPGAGGNIDG
jgi:hypothetical protein